MNRNSLIETSKDFSGRINYKDSYYDSPVKEQMLRGIYISKIRNFNLNDDIASSKDNSDTGSYHSINDKQNSVNSNKESDNDASHDYNFLVNSDKIEDKVSEYKDKIQLSLNNFDYSSESLALTETQISEVISVFSFEILGNILQSINLDNYDKKHILCGICQTLERFDLKEVNPWGPTLMLSILSHRDESIKAYAISTIDNWADISLLPVLKNIDCSSKWLKSYVEEVISILEV